MPTPPHFFGENHFHFLTSSTYHRVRLFRSFSFCEEFIKTLDHLRTEQEFRLLGYVLMPDHFHLLIWPSDKANPSKIIGSLKERTAKLIIKKLKKESEAPWCMKMLKAIQLPTSVHNEATYRVWQRRFYDFNVWSEKKRLEKLEYMHGNPVKARLVDSPEAWKWSSWRFYNLEDYSLLNMDRLP
jgi:putative transposase